MKQLISSAHCAILLLSLLLLALPDGARGGKGMNTFAFVDAFNNNDPYQHQQDPHNPHIHNGQHHHQHQQHAHHHAGAGGVGGASGHHHGAGGGGGQPPPPQDDAQLLFNQPVLELLSISGCATDSHPRRSTSECDTSKPIKLTLRGRNLPQGGIQRVVLVKANPTATKNSQSSSTQQKDSESGASSTSSYQPAPATIECVNIIHSKTLPTLLAHCTIPQLSITYGEMLDELYHVRVMTHRRHQLILRNAVAFKSKDLMSSAGGKRNADGSLKKKGDSPLTSGNWSANYEELGVGGLQTQLDELFRRAFSSRLSANAGIANEIGVRHIKGVILHGPPGTGKTLIARKVGDLLNAKSVQVVSGPEIMSKFVGESEKNLRALFSQAESDAEKEKETGKPAGLHVIIMDEIDAIMRPRGAGDDSGARAVYDGVTTQMLAYMDGFKSSNNLLIIGLTNRLSSMDKALLRPGRFEVQIRIPLPDEDGRLQIFKIHTKKLRENNYLAQEVDLRMVASRAAALSGADIAGIVRSAVSFAFERHQQAVASYEEKVEVFLHENEQRFNDEGQDAENRRIIAHDELGIAEPHFSVNMNDLAKGIKEVIAAKGSSVNTQPFLERGVVLHSANFHNQLKRLWKLTDQMRDSAALRRLRVVLEGPSGSGITAVAALVARNSRFASVNVITPESLVGLGTSQKVERLTTIFEEAANVAHACIVLDKVEQIVEYNHHHNKLNAVLAQELSVLLDRNLALLPYQQESRLLVILTTSHGSQVLKHLNPSATSSSSGGGLPSLSTSGGGAAVAGFDAHEQFTLLDKDSMTRVLEGYRVFDGGDLSATNNNNNKKNSADQSREAVAKYLPRKMSVKQLIFLIDAARSRYGISTPHHKLPVEAYDAVARSEPGEVIKVKEEDSDKKEKKEKEGGAEASEFLTVEQFGRVAQEFGIEGSSTSSFSTEGDSQEGGWGTDFETMSLEL